MTTRPLLLIAAIGTLPGVLPGASGDVPCGDLATRVSTAEKARDARIGEVKSIRRYVLRNPRWKTDGVATVLFTYEPDGRKKYEILTMKAEGLQERVLKRILDGEVEASVKKSEDASISPDNYQITPIGYDTIRGRRCILVRLTPLRKSRTLIDGRAWIDEREAAPVRVEGHTAKSLSF